MKNAPKKIPKHYVDNQKFFVAICDYKAELKRCRDAQLEKPIMPDFLGMCFWGIAKNYANHRWFIGYHNFKEDMIADAVYTCIKYVDTFDPTRTRNPFAYFTRAVHFAFRQKVEKERKYLITKLKAIKNTELFEKTAATQPGDEGSEKLDSVQYSDYSREKMEEFVDEYDKRNRRK